MRHSNKLITALCVGCMAVFFLTSAQAKEAPKKITFVSGSMGGTWYNSAATVSQILMKAIPGFQITATSGRALGNIRLVDDGTDAQLAWTYLAFVFEAMKGESPFKTKHKNIAVIIPNMLGSPYLVATKKSGIKDWGDLKGKRLLTFRPGSIMELLTRQILAGYGITYDDIRKAGGSVNFVQFNQGVSLMKDGRADALMVPGTYNAPIAGVLDLQTTMALVFPTIRQDVIEEFCKRHPGFIPWHLNGGLYKGEDKPVNLPAGVCVLITRRDYPNNFVYQVTKAIYTHRDQLVGISKAYQYISKENLSRGVPADVFHPGALKYIKEVQGR